jgi:putative ABC transport system permease protein
MEDYFRLRARWRAGDLPALSHVMPVVEGSMLVADRTLSIVGLDAFSGVPEALGLAFLPVGQGIVSPDSGYSVGDRLDAGGFAVRVARLHDAVPRGMLLTDIGTAQVALGFDDSALTSVAVIVRTPLQRILTWSDRLMPGFSAGIRVPEWRLEGWTVRTLDAELPSLAFARSVLFNLGALGSLALVVAWLLVYQVGVIWLRRRQQTLERLRQMGATDRELRSSFLLSLAGAGLVAGVVGLWAGNTLAALLAQTVTGYAGDETSFRPDIDRWVVAKALGSAVGVSIVGGWLAYSRERRSRADGRTQGLVLLILMLAWIFGTYLSETLLAGFLSIAAVGLMVLVGIHPVLSWLKSSSRRVRGTLLARVGLRELVWYPNDLAVAVGALALALATSIAIALMGGSFRADFERMLDRRMVHDVFVTGDGRDLDALIPAISRHPDVARVQAYGRAERVIRGVKVELGHTRFDIAESARYGMTRALLPGECLVSERLANSLGISPGDRLELGESVVTVAGVFAGFGDPQPRLLLGEESATVLGLPVGHDRLSIHTDSKQTVMAFVASLDPTLNVQERGTLRETALRIFDQTFAITQALTFMALIVASVGLYNALLALELLLMRSRFLLQAMGVVRGELNTIDRWRIAGVGSAAILFAVPLGIVMGWLLCRVINPRAFGWSLDFLIQWPSFAWPILSVVLAMVVVAMVPTPSEGTFDEG